MATPTPTIAQYAGAHNPMTSAAYELQETRDERYARYALNWAYYRNEMYDADIREKFSGAAARRIAENLYYHIKPVFNPCGQAAHTDASAVLVEPVLQSASAKLLAEAEDVWKRSKLLAGLWQFILWGSVYGDASLRLANETIEPRLIRHPGTELDVEIDPHDSDKIIRATLSYNFFSPDTDDLTLHVYRMDITPDQYATYLDDVLHDYGNGASEWDNTLGWVPVAPLRLIDTGQVYGDCTFQNVLPQLDLVSEIASQMADIVRINADPILVGYNIKAGDITIGQDSDGDRKKGRTSIVYINNRAGVPVEARLERLEWSGNLQGMTDYINWCKGNVEEQLPEWHLKRIREQGAPSGYAVQLQLSELLTKLRAMRINAIETLKQGTAMAIAAKQRLPLSEVDNIAADLDIECGSILPPDTESDAKIIYMDMQNDLISHAEAMRKRGYDEDDIQRIRDEIAAEKEESMARGMAMFGGDSDSPDDAQDDAGQTDEADDDSDADNEDGQ